MSKKKTKGKIELTEQEENAIYELLIKYLFDYKNPPNVGLLGISPDAYVGLIKLFERLPINRGKKKTDYNKLLKWIKEMI